MISSNLPADYASALMYYSLYAGAMAALGGNDGLTAATAAVASEAAAPVLAHALYGSDITALSPDEKRTIASIARLIGAGIGASTGSEATVVQSAQAAGTAVQENQFTQMRGLFGVDNWGPAAASLVDHMVHEGKTSEEITEALREQRTGVGYESGVSQGIVIWTVAPASTVAVAQSPVVLASPPVAQAAKGYGLAAGASIAESVVISNLTKSDYNVSNFFSDLTIGALNNAATKSLIKAAKPIGTASDTPKAIEIFLNNHGRAQGYFLGSGTASALEYYMGDMRKTLINFSRQKEQDKSRD